jgi:hypothetical protein
LRLLLAAHDNEMFSPSFTGEDEILIMGASIPRKVIVFSGILKCYFIVALKHSYDMTMIYNV